MNHLPKIGRLPLTSADQSIHFSPLLAAVALLETDAVFSRMKSSPRL